tara:strand:- start:264 stop:638 length:375 start_codon:yes stop_codon:yes gene_type:complete
MKNPFMPRFRMDHKLPPGSFWRRMKWHGNDVDVYFFSESHGDSYMCRRSNTNYDYSSGDAGRLPMNMGFSNDTPLEHQVQRLREIIDLTRAYQEWKGLRKCEDQELRDFFKEETDAKHLELSPE